MDFVSPCFLSYIIAVAVLVAIIILGYLTPQNNESILVLMKATWQELREKHQFADKCLIVLMFVLAKRKASLYTVAIIFGPPLLLAAASVCGSMGPWDLLIRIIDTLFLKQNDM